MEPGQQGSTNHPWSRTRSGIFQIPVFDMPMNSKERQREQVKQWKAERPWYDLERRRRRLRDRPVEESSLLVFNSARHRAIRKGLEFDICLKDVTEMISAGHCNLTGIKFEFELGSALMPSIDRIDNSLGYTKSNCRAVLWFLNRAKSRLSDAEFFWLMKATAKRLPRGRKPRLERTAAIQMTIRFSF